MPVQLQLIFGSGLPYCNIPMTNRGPLGLRTSIQGFQPLSVPVDHENRVRNFILSGAPGDYS